MEKEQSPSESIGSLNQILEVYTRSHGRQQTNGLSQHILCSNNTADFTSTTQNSENSLESTGSYQISIDSRERTPTLMDLISDPNTPSPTSFSEPTRSLNDLVLEDDTCTRFSA